METIRILQNIYEDLYAARLPLSQFLENRLPVLSSQWKRECVERVLNEKVDKNFNELDIYYLIQILTDDKNWNDLQNCFPQDSYYFLEENKRLYKKVKKIRNDIMHPSLNSFTYNDFLNYENAINSFVNIFSPDKTLRQLVFELHLSEKEKLLGLIKANVINPALECKNLPENIKQSVENTLERLEMQNTAQGIIAFFNDALNSKQGQEICAVLHQNNLKAFEDIKSKIEETYYS